MKKTKLFLLIFVVIFFLGCKDISDNPDYTFITIHFINLMDKDLTGLKIKTPYQKEIEISESGDLKIYYKKKDKVKLLRLGVKESNESLGKMPLFVDIDDKSNSVLNYLFIKDIQSEKEYNFIILPTFSLSCEKKDMIFEDDLFDTRFTLSYKSSEYFLFDFLIVANIQISNFKVDNFTLRELFKTKGLYFEVFKSTHNIYNDKEFTLIPEDYHLNAYFTLIYKDKKYFFTYPSDYYLVLNQRNSYYFDEVFQD